LNTAGVLGMNLQMMANDEPFSREGNHVKDDSVPCEADQREEELRDDDDSAARKGAWADDVVEDGNAVVCVLRVCCVLCVCVVCCVVLLLLLLLWSVCGCGYRGLNWRVGRIGWPAVHRYL